MTKDVFKCMTILLPFLISFSLFTRFFFLSTFRSFWYCAFRERSMATVMILPRGVRMYVCVSAWFFFSFWVGAVCPSWCWKVLSYRTGFSDNWVSINGGRGWMDGGFI